MELNNKVREGTTNYYTTVSTISDDVNKWVRKDVKGSTTYFGYSENMGSDTSKPIWKIRKESIVGSETVITYADGDFNYDNVWNNRESLIYK